MDIDAIVKDFLSSLCTKTDESHYIIDMTDKDILLKFQDFIGNLFNNIFEYAASTVYNDNENTDVNTRAYKITMLGNQLWNQVSDKLDAEDIICKLFGSNQKKFEFERSGFILCMMGVDPDILKRFKPAIDDLIAHDLGKEYIEYKNEHRNDKPVTMNEELAEQLPSENEIDDKDLLMEYFKTCKALGNFIGMREYDTEQECQLHDRLMRLYQRIYDKGL